MPRLCSSPPRPAASRDRARVVPIWLTATGAETEAAAPPPTPRPRTPPRPPPEPRSGRETLVARAAARRRSSRWRLGSPHTPGGALAVPRRRRAPSSFDGAPTSPPWRTRAPRATRSSRASREDDQRTTGPVGSPPWATRSSARRGADETGGGGGCGGAGVRGGTSWHEMLGAHTQASGGLGSASLSDPRPHHQRHIGAYLFRRRLPRETLDASRVASSAGAWRDKIVVRTAVSRDLAGRSSTRGAKVAVAPSAGRRRFWGAAPPRRGGRGNAGGGGSRARRRRRGEMREGGPAAAGGGGAPGAALGDFFGAFYHALYVVGGRGGRARGGRASCAAVRILQVPHADRRGDPRAKAGRTTCSRMSDERGAKRRDDCDGDEEDPPPPAVF